MNNPPPKNYLYPYRHYLTSPWLSAAFILALLILKLTGYVGWPTTILLAVLTLHVLALAFYWWQTHAEIKFYLKQADQHLAAWERLTQPPSDNHQELP